MVPQARIDQTLNGSTKLDVPEILRRIVTPLSFFGLAVIGLTAIGIVALNSNMDSSLKFFSLVGAAGLIYGCFLSVSKKIRRPRDLVVDAEYHKQDLVVNFIEGSGLRDFIDDRVQQALDDRSITERKPDQVGDSRGSLTLKRMREDLEQVGRR